MPAARDAVAQTHAAKPRRTKAAKLAYLKRSAAAKARWHRVRHRKLATQHMAVAGLLVVLVVSGISTAGAMAADLIPPPSPDINMDAYLRNARQVEATAGTLPVRAPDQVGRGSWYALGLSQPDALTCASTRFPRGTSLQVTDLRNGHQVTCLVNDYGPTAATGRVIDLSRGSYRFLEGLGSGTMPVEIRVVPGS